MEADFLSHRLHWLGLGWRLRSEATDIQLVFKESCPLVAHAASAGWARRSIATTSAAKVLAFFIAPSRPLTWAMLRLSIVPPKLKMARKASRSCIWVCSDGTPC